MADNDAFRVKKRLNLKTNTSAGTDPGDIRYDGSGNLQLRDGSSEKTILDQDNTVTVTNKSIDADTNTITNIGNDEIIAGVDAAKLADGSVTNTEFQYLSEVTSDIQGQLDAKALASDLTDHINDTADAHAASAITNTPSGNLAATTVQGAVDELQGDIDTINSSLPTGDIVGTTDTQILSSKTLTSPVLNGTLSGTAFLDEDTMTSNSATAVASQQSIKAYVDNSVSATQDIAVTSINNTDSPYTVLSTDYLILVDASSAAVTVNLPTAVGIEGKQYIIKKTDTSLSNGVTVDASTTETIDGALTKTLRTQNESIKLVSDGANWQLIERRIPSEWQAYTPTIVGFGSPSSVEFYYKRKGNSLDIDGNFVCGISTATEARINLPAGLFVSSTPTYVGTSGIWAVAVTAVNKGGLQLYTAGDNYINFGNVAFGSASRNPYQISNGNEVAASGNIVKVRAYGIPIQGWEG